MTEELAFVRDLCLENSEDCYVLQWLYFRDSPFHCTIYDYSHADWDGIRKYLREVPWDDIFKLDASVAATDYCK